MVPERRPGVSRSSTARTPCRGQAAPERLRDPRLVRRQPGRRGCARRTRRTRARRPRSPRSPCPTSPKTSIPVPSRRRSTPSHSMAAMVRARRLSARYARGTQQEVMVERVAFVGLGTMGAAMAANLARAGFQVTAWNRTPGRAPDLAGFGVTEVATAGRRRPRRPTSSSAVSATPPTSRRCCSARRRRRRARGGRPGHRLLHDRARRHRRLRPPAPRARHRHGGRAGLRRLRGGPQGDAHDLRRRRARWTSERARPVLAAMGTTITHFGPSAPGRR